MTTTTRQTATANENEELSTTATTMKVDLSASSSSNNHNTNHWIQQGLLISSFSDGLEKSTAAQSILRRGLLFALLKEQQASLETTIRSSVLASPCCGPTNVAALEALQNVDDQLESLNNMSMNMNDASNDSTEQLWQQYLSNNNNNNNATVPLMLRVLYIPTAMYALRADSQNTPGKQRQRARADGKKRRNELVQFLLKLFATNDDDDDDDDKSDKNSDSNNNDNNSNNSIAIQVVTLDWDDGSVKQPEVVVSGKSNNRNDNALSSSSSTVFPTTGQEAMRDWMPHLVYVQGGNTFWLHHCLQKGNWTHDFVHLLCGSNKNNDNNKNHHSAFYIGASAGAILVGSTMQTACWKGWDDPRVVPGQQDYADWEQVPGLSLVGKVAFFPHMEDSWKELVESKSQELLNTNNDDDDDNNNNNKTIHVCTLADHEVCFVDGIQQTTRFLWAEQMFPST